MSSNAFPLASCDGEMEPTWLLETARLQVRIHHFVYIVKVNAESIQKKN